VLTHRLEFVPDRDTELFATVPAAPAVFLLRGDDPQSEPYVTKTANLRRRLQRLLGVQASLASYARLDSPFDSAQGRLGRLSLRGRLSLNLRDRVRQIEYSPVGSDFESGFLLYKLLRSTFPKTYGERLRFRFAPLIKLHMENKYPRASVTTRLGRLGGRSLYYGPFPSRTVAEKYANDSLDFFLMRRCVEDLNPDPKFPGCIYSEMKMCLAPCFEGCTDDEYRAEVARVRAYLDTGGHSLVREISTQRDTASANLEFEKAAALHTRLEKVKPVASQLPEVVHRIDRLAGVVVQPSATPESVNFFRIDTGCIAGPAVFPIQPTEHTKSQSMESRLQEALAAIAPVGTKTALETMEHLALLKRWYYRSNRVGEVFFTDEKGVLPLRRIVRGISRVYHGEKPERGISERIDPSPLLPPAPG
jgi:excinuclease ABC subunit C